MAFNSPPVDSSSPETPAQPARPLRHWDPSDYDDTERAAAPVSQGPALRRWAGIALRTLRTRRSLAAVLLLVLALIGNSLYDYYGPIRFASSPASSIGSIPHEGVWPMAHRGPERNAFVEARGFKPPSEVKWRFDAGAPILSSPAVVDGAVFLSIMDGRVVSLEAASGNVAWEHATGALMRSSLAVAGDLVIVGVEDGRVIALDRGTGELRWEFETEKPVLSPPAVYEGVVYVGSNDWHVYALDAASGERRWSYKARDSIQSGPAVNEDVVTFTDLTNRFYTLDRDSGAFLMDFKTAGPARGGAVMRGKRAYVADRGGRIRAIDWSVRNLPFEKALLRIRAQLYYWNMISVAPTQKGSLWYFRKRGEEFRTTPVAAWNNVYAASGSGAVFAVNNDSGAGVWSSKRRVPSWPRRRW